MPEIIAYRNEKRFFRVSFSGHHYSIGRSLTNDLTLPDQDISRHHAEIYRRGQFFYLRDKSQGRTLVHGKPIKTDTPIHDSSKINLGQWELVFHQVAKEENKRLAEIETQIANLNSIESGGQTKVIQIDQAKNQVVQEEAFLVLTLPDQQTKTFTLNKNRVRLGSAKGSDLVINDEYISGEHAELRLSSQGWKLIDLGSTNGSYLDGSAITKAYIKPGQTIQLGQTRIEIRDHLVRKDIQPEKTNQFCGLVGESKSMQLLYSKIKKVAPVEHTVLIQGESGTGKELVARAVHDLSSRKNKPYITINCGAISPNLIESELFGHEKGAFTGAQGRHAGAFEQANGGSIFLDEIGELPLDLQPKLLRVLENRTVRRVGGSEELKVDVRVIAATHRDLAQLVKEGKFRQDLYFRLYVLPLDLAPLAQRKDDAVLIAEHFLKQANSTVKKISDQAKERIKAYPWPGNIRELKNVIMRSIIFCEGDTIEPDDLDLMEVGPSLEASVGHQPNPTPATLDSDSLPEAAPAGATLADAEKAKILEALQVTNGNKTRAAQRLGIAKSTLFKKFKDYNIPL